MKKKELRTTSHRLGFGMLVSALLLLAAGVTSCAKEEDPNRLPDGKYPMTFTAQVEGPTAKKAATRATGKDAWAENDLIAVATNADGSHSKVYQITDAATGAMAPNVAGEACYWQFSKKQPIRAWYPAEGGTDVDISDQSGGYASFDYLTSDGTYDLAQTVALPFKHQMAKVKYTLLPGEGISEGDLASATVQIHGYTKASFAGGTLSGHTQGWVMPYAAGHEAIVVPQQMQNEKFIRVTINGADYLYTPMNATDANLEAGKQYIYTITVKKNGITVTASDATVWGGETSDIKGKVIKQGFAAFDLKMGDYYYSDGAWSDGGYRVYVDGTTATLPIMPVLTDASGNPRTILGIVLKVGRDLAGDCKDDCQYKLKDGTTEMNTIHGYVLALYDANEGKECKWSPDGTEVGTKTEATGFDGYTNTNKIKAFAKTENKTLKTDFPATYSATEGYEATHPAPDNTSGWFLPSVGQCQYWFNNKNVLLESVRKVTGTAESNWAYFYWSSSESNYSPAGFAWCLSFRGGSVGDGHKDYGNCVRSVLAF